MRVTVPGGVDPCLSNAVGDRLGVGKARSATTAITGTDMLRSAMANPDNAVEGALKLKGSSASDGLWASSPEERETGSVGMEWRLINSVPRLCGGLMGQF